MVKKYSWLDDIINALRNLNGFAHLNDIYKEVRRIQRMRRKEEVNSFEASIRGVIETNSLDSKKSKGKDFFYSLHGLDYGVGDGMWGLTEAIREPQHTVKPNSRNRISKQEIIDRLNSMPKDEAEKIKALLKKLGFSFELG